MLELNWAAQEWPPPAQVRRSRLPAPWCTGSRCLLALIILAFPQLPGHPSGKHVSTRVQFLLKDGQRVLCIFFFLRMPKIKTLHLLTIS